MEARLLRFKQFSGTAAELEGAINSWLTQYEPDVRQMVQTIGPNGTVSISFLFEESFVGQELRFSSERGMNMSSQPVISPESIPGEPVHVTEEPGDIMPEQP